MVAVRPALNGIRAGFRQQSGELHAFLDGGAFGVAVFHDIDKAGNREVLARAVF